MIEDLKIKLMEVRSKEAITEKQQSREIKISHQGLRNFMKSKTTPTFVVLSKIKNYLRTKGYDII